MLRPVGTLSPSVYRRRRLSVAVIGLVLILLLGWLVFGRGRGGNAGAGPPGSGRTPASAATGATSAPDHATTSKAPGATGSAHAAHRGRVCAPADLQIQAATGHPTYAVGAQPDLYLQVTDIGGKPCRQDLADRPIEMRITIAGVRVWGSHDCAIEPGTDVVKLLPKQPVRRAVVWSGLTSTPGCKGTRLRAEAGVYDLTSVLDGRASAPRAFTLTAKSGTSPAGIWIGVAPRS